MYSTQRVKLVPELDGPRLATAYNGFVELRYPFTVKNGLDHQVDNMPGASQALLRADCRDFSMQCRNESVVFEALSIIKQPSCSVMW